MTKRTFKRKERKKKDFTHEDAIRAVRCWFVIHTDTGGYTENEFTFHRFADGGITISEDDGDGFLYFHDKEIIDILRELL